MKCWSSGCGPTKGNCSSYRTTMALISSDLTLKELSKFPIFTPAGQEKHLLLLKKSLPISINFLVNISLWKSKPVSTKQFTYECNVSLVSSDRENLVKFIKGLLLIY